jgi:hypothetical protein
LVTQPKWRAVWFLAGVALVLIVWMLVEFERCQFISRQP